MQIKKAARTPTLARWGREQSLSLGAAHPWHRLSSWRADLFQETSTLRWALNPMSKCNPNLSDQGYVRISDPFPQGPV